MRVLVNLFKAWLHIIAMNTHKTATLEFTGKEFKTATFGIYWERVYSREVAAPVSDISSPDLVRSICGVCGCACVSSDRAKG